MTPKTNVTHYNHLFEVNQQWEKYADFAPIESITFDSDEDRIQSHINLVINYLVEHTSSDLTASQKDNRIHLLQELAEYADAKTFPKNTVYQHRQPCFVDENETHCAVGYLMAVSGHNTLVATIRSEYNYAYLKDIKTDGVSKWADEFGFTLAELMWIQPTYYPTNHYDPLGEGTNGIVRIMERAYGADFVFAGDFTELDGLPCLNIGVYEDETLTCLGGGIAGTVNAVYSKLGDYYVFGALINDGVTYPMATFIDETWTYTSIPTREGAISTAGFHGPYGYQIELALSHPAIAGQEIWFLNDAGEWIKKAAIDGTIYDIASSGYGHVYVGNFSSSITVTEDGGYDLNLAKNILIRKRHYEEWSVINQPVSDTIKCVKEVGSTLYFGGSASTDTESDICLSRYNLGTISPLQLFSHFASPSYVSINDIAYTYDSKIILAGDFVTDGEFGTYGRYLAYYHLIYDHLEAIARLNKSTACVYWNSSGLFIGGEFTANQTGETLNHLAIQREIVGDPESINEVQLEVFPNPFVNSVQVKGISGIKTYTLMNQLGQIVKQGEVENQSIQELADLPKGHYILILKTETKEWQVKLIK
ncbi:MAG: T9SS type A sorting domain-containing protein [Crocinitomix sp.]|nr:T9SS type A sorting domain-containing protein [Crocinitomix sp.]